MRFVRLLLFVPLLAASLAAQSKLVISQVYGGGGATSGSPTYTRDFVELFNAGNATANLSGLSLQYASSTGSSWSVAPLSGSLAAGQYFLVVLGSTGTAGATIPIASDVASTALNLSATTGKVALASGTAALSGACPSANVVDMVGYGSGVSCSETSPTPTLTNATAVLRASGGCVDTGNNALDFSVGVATPRNTSSALNPCSAPAALAITTSPTLTATANKPFSTALTASGGSGAGYTFALTAGTLPTGINLTGAALGGTTASTGAFPFTITVTDSKGATASLAFTLTVNAAPACVITRTIADIQNTELVSPFAGTVQTTSGIVTGRKSNGYFIQMPSPGDNNPATSDGIFVFTSAAPPADAAIGNLVCVQGTIAEFSPSTDPNSPPMTEISGSPVTTLVSTGNTLPAPVVLSVTLPAPDGGISQLERYEGMRVQVNALTVVGPTLGTLAEASATSTSTGFFYGVVQGQAQPFREPGVELPDPLPAGSPCCVPRFDANPEILGIASAAQPGAIAIDVPTGAVVSNVVGPLDFANRHYAIDVDAATPPAVTGANRTYTAVPAAAASEFTIASFNMQRFYDTADAPGTSDVALTQTAFNNRLAKASLAIRKVLNYPDILGVEEVENLTTLHMIAARVNADAAAEGQSPAYQPFLEEGNDVGGINVGFLVKLSKVSVVSVAQLGKDTTFLNPVSNAQDILNDRPPLVLKAQISGYPLTVIANHLRSLSGVDTDARVRAKRAAQAEYLAKLIQSRVSAGENVASIGDYNAYQFSDGYVDVMGIIRGAPADPNSVVVPSTLTSAPLVDLAETLSASQRYSYSFQGSAQVLDHILVSSGLYSRFNRFAYARNDADFPEVLRNDATRPERLSDHDVPVAYFTLPAASGPKDVTSSVNLVISGLAYNRFTHVYTGAIAVENTSAAAIGGPVQLVFQGLPAGVTLLNATGATPAGLPYIIASTAALAPGASATISVQFSNTGTSPVTYSNQVLSGGF